MITKSQFHTTPKLMKKSSNIKTKLKNILMEAFDNTLITKEELEAMDPEGKNVSKFYMTFKIHKEHVHGQAPPERPICSGSGSMLENVSKYIEQFIKKTWH